MKRLLSPFLLVLLLGFLAGNLAGTLGFQLIAPENTGMEIASGAQGGSRQKKGPAPANTAAYVRDQAVATVPEETVPEETVAEEEDPDPRYLIPPHLEDPSFFGPDPEDYETRLMREQAAAEFIESLEQTDLTDLEIAAMKEAVADLLEAETSTGFEHDDEAVARPDAEEEAHLTAESFRDAGESEEFVQEMLDGVLQNMEAPQELGTPEEAMEQEELDRLFRE